MSCQKRSFIISRDASSSSQRLQQQQKASTLENASYSRNAGNSTYTVETLQK
jgi:hypothetical protein